MNVANLQLEGLCLAIAAINRALVSKGLLSEAELESALRGAEEASVADPEFLTNCHLRTRTPSVFQYVRLANASSDGRSLSFAELAKTVGATKPQ